METDFSKGWKLKVVSWGLEGEMEDINLTHSTKLP